MKAEVSTITTYRHFLNYTFILGAVHVVYALYMFRLIYSNTNWMEDGMEWVAVMPFGFIFIALVGPALVMRRDGRWLKLAAFLVIVGVVLNVLLLFEIASELTGGYSRALDL